jgi:hypothetical protein
MCRCGGGERVGGSLDGESNDFAAPAILFLRSWVSRCFHL